jgi:hypothetical protein
MHPKHAGRYLPLSPELSFGQARWTCTSLSPASKAGGPLSDPVPDEFWSGWGDSNPRSPAPEAGGLAATLQPEMFLGKFFVGVVVLGLLAADRAVDRKILEALASHPVMIAEEAEGPGEPSPLGPPTPGRLDVWHLPRFQHVLLD